MCRHSHPRLTLLIPLWDYSRAHHWILSAVFKKRAREDFHVFLLFTSVGLSVANAARFSPGFLRSKKADLNPQDTAPSQSIRTLPPYVPYRNALKLKISHVQVRRLARRIMIESGFNKSFLQKEGTS